MSIRKGFSFAESSVMKPAYDQTRIYHHLATPTPPGVTGPLIRCARPVAHSPLETSVPPLTQGQAYVTALASIFEKDDPDDPVRSANL
ncbi:hypothetical protein AB9K35_13810 [Leisingera sp. XS_AS12]|uniref:hypothetical protein n=1 Tax=Leisingera sp. XS_AS12 TaxID=3241294 RepID=UPI003515CFC8